MKLNRAGKRKTKEKVRKKKMPDERKRKNLILSIIKIL